MAPRQSYGAIISIKHEDEQEIQHLVSESNTSTTTTTITGADSKKKYFMIAAVAIVGFVVVEFSYPKIVGKSYTAESQNYGGGTSKNGIAYFGEGSSVLTSLSPVDLGFKSIERESDASPSDIWGNRTGPLPTNSWYLVSHARRSLSALTILTSILRY